MRTIGRIVCTIAVAYFVKGVVKSMCDAVLEGVVEAVDKRIDEKIAAEIAKQKVVYHTYPIDKSTPGYPWGPQKFWESPITVGDVTTSGTHA